MTKQLTEKQKETLEVIQTFIQSNGISPTLSELQDLLSVSSNQAVLNHLDALEEKGYIEKKKMARGIRLLTSAVENAVGNSDDELLDILTDIAIKKKERKSKKTTVGYSNPYSEDDASGEILVGYYNNEQY